MAADDLLLEQDEPTLRLYGWSRPTLSLGYSQPCGWIPLELEAVRRPSGGRALLHWHETTYCIVLPGAGALPVKAAYAGLTDLLGQALRSLGVPVETSPTSSAIPSSAQNPGCMGFVQAGELTAGGAKLVGSAQLRRGAGLLQHGSIPWRPPPDLFPGAGAGTSLESLGLPPLNHAELASAFFQAFGGDFAERPWSEEELEGVEARSARFRLEARGKGP